MHINEDIIKNVVAQVLAEVGPIPEVSSSSYAGRHGIFDCAEEAVQAAHDAFEQLSERGMEDRKKIIDHIRRISIEQCVELGTMEMEETKIGRLEHKIEKLKTLGEQTPGVEFMKSECFSGDHGLAVIEHAPFGVIGAITPVTHSLPTITGNAVSMIASGNTLVVNPHPSGKKVAAEGVRRFNEAIYKDLGIDNLICLIAEPTLESADIIFNHRDVALICVTGGPAVARAALRAGKRAIVAGPGNPPVVVDETADLDRAARSMIQGASYDNNLLCIAEKEVFVVDSVFDSLMNAMERAGAARLNSQEIDRLTSAAMIQVGEDNHDAPSKECLGQDAAKLAQFAGRQVPAGTELVFGETDEHHPFVSVEQMMPFLPFVRCRNVDEAIQKAKHYEHGFRHTSIIHSHDVRNMTRMGRIMDTTLFVKNGPCMASLGLGGEGYLSFSIAGPTGEGVTTPLTFTRERRCSMIDDLWILGQPKN
ncbi:MAG: aldehyde dehydrogenase family protein [Planctomycetota bacterium]|nr:aldehyde dehydrogenase family protein [Planctomycetota bacterium]MEC7445317.1 aldehyde dehydrogenase family protein [Planctomycetota bacterium]MEC7499046.1 aldehyde dehydrogenase family protein [Planctomycetota bacterium]MEC7598602.1 aldehyde dehydrogenase family protein [Planctomycetota bacterium]MEC8159824.1 aldehyde dehydrogenase family protein [Planctomycetota bacterium]